VLLAGLYAWAMEPSTEPDDGHHPEPPIAASDAPAPDPAAALTAATEGGDTDG
jgi:hypothetical protein